LVYVPDTTPKETKDLLKNILQTKKVYYDEVDTKQAFDDLIQTGHYSMYINLDDMNLVGGQLSDELIEQIYGGKRILYSKWKNGGRDTDNLTSIFGTKFEGQSYDLTDLILLNSPITTEGTLTTIGKVDKGELIPDTTAVMAGKYILQGKKGVTEELPGIVINEFGKGKGVTYNFDFSQSLNNDREKFTELLTKSIEYLLEPEPETQNPPGSLSRIGIIVTNKDTKPFTIRLEEVLFKDAIVADTFGGEKTADTIVWTFDLSPEESKTVNYHLVTPDTAQESQTILSYLYSGKYYLYDKYNFTVTPAKDRIVTIDEIIPLLDALTNLNPDDQNRINGIKTTLEALKTSTPTTKAEWNEAINNILTSMAQLLKVEGITPEQREEIRLKLDYLLKCYEGKWAVSE